MSRIKSLRESPDNCLNIIDILSIIIPSEKSIYYETFIRCMKNTYRYSETNIEIREHLIETFGGSPEKVNKIPDFQLMFFYKFLDGALVNEDIVTYKKFVSLNENKNIEFNDITTYSTIKEIENAVSIAELKKNTKNLEKQTHKIYEDDVYVMVRPLTHLSSKKYGASTTWCTSMNNEYAHFKRYAERGILIYTINKKTGLKVACFYSLTPEKEFSFWNQLDIRIDSLESELPENILKIIMNEIKTNPVSNRSMLSEVDREKDDKMNMRENRKMMSPMEDPRMITDGDVDDVSLREQVIRRAMIEDHQLTQRIQQIEVDIPTMDDGSEDRMIDNDEVQISRD